jgi:hypothetical protein
MTHTYDGIYTPSGALLEVTKFESNIGNINH